MFLFGILIGLIDIVVGIIAIFNSKGEWSLVLPGIINILSGLLFLWLCYGVQTTFDHKKEIEAMKSDIENLTAQNKSLEEEVEKLKSNNEQESK